jgi:hypothetical protein
MTLRSHPRRDIDEALNAKPGHPAGDVFMIGGPIFRLDRLLKENGAGKLKL